MQDIWNTVCSNTYMTHITCLMEQEVWEWVWLLLLVSVLSLSVPRSTKGPPIASGPASSQSDLKSSPWLQQQQPAIMFRGAVRPSCFLICFISACQTQGSHDGSRSPMFPCRFSVCLYETEVKQRGAFVYIYWLDQLTGEPLAHIPNRGEKEDKTRMHAASEWLFVFQMDVWEIWERVMKELREQGMKAKEKTCQIKDMLWLDNEALEVNMSAIFRAQEWVGNKFNFHTLVLVKSRIIKKHVKDSHLKGSHHVMNNQSNEPLSSY